MLSVDPNLTQAQVREAMKSGCTKLSGYVFSSNSSHPGGTWNDQVGHGLVNAYAALIAVTSNVTSGIDFIINNNSSYELYNVGIEVKGKLGTDNYFTTFISREPGLIPPGSYAGYPNNVDNLTVPGGIGISDIYLNIYARIQGGGTVYVRFNIDYTDIVGSYVNFSNNGNRISDHLGNDYGLLYPRGSSIPYSGRRMLTVNILNNW